MNKPQLIKDVKAAGIDFKFPLAEEKNSVEFFCYAYDKLFTYLESESISDADFENRMNAFDFYFNELTEELKCTI